MDSVNALSRELNEFNNNKMLFGGEPRMFLMGLPQKLSSIRKSHFSTAAIKRGGLNVIDFIQLGNPIHPKRKYKIRAFGHRFERRGKIYVGQTV